MKFTKAKTEMLLTIMDDFNEFIKDRIRQYEEAQGNNTYRISFAEMEYNPYNIGYTREIYQCGCCPPDEEYASMPSKYLWDDGLIEKLQEETRVRKETEQRKKEEAERKRKADLERLEHEQYKLLKEKYGNA
jgi:hypothetical protein